MQRQQGSWSRHLLSALQALLPHLSSVRQPEQTLGPFFFWTAKIAENVVRFVIVSYSPPQRSRQPVLALPRLSYSRGRGSARSYGFRGAEIRNWGYEKGCPSILFQLPRQKSTGLFGYKACKGRRADLLSQPFLSCLTEE